MEDSALRGILDDCVVLIESLSILDIESIEIPLRTDELQKEEVQLSSVKYDTVYYSAALHSAVPCCTVS
jgi:hypothetical protein